MLRQKTLGTCEGHPARGALPHQRRSRQLPAQNDWRGSKKWHQQPAWVNTFFLVAWEVEPSLEIQQRKKKTYDIYI